MLLGVPRREKSPPLSGRAVALSQLIEKEEDLGEVVLEQGGAGATDDTSISLPRVHPQHLLREEIDHIGN